MKLRWTGIALLAIASAGMGFDWLATSGRATAAEIGSGHWRPARDPAEERRDSDAGRVSALAFDPSAASTIYAATPSGGMWRTTNDGAVWAPLTQISNKDAVAKDAESGDRDARDPDAKDPGGKDADKIDADRKDSDSPDAGAATGTTVTDIAIDPKNPRTVYLLTGDGDEAGQAGANIIDSHPTASTGVLKSTDRGETWQTTGLAWDARDSEFAHRLAIDPTRPEVLFAATSAGLFRTTDGGRHWSVVIESDGGAHADKDLDPSRRNPFWDVVLGPANPSLVYAASQTKIYRSLDSGQTWTELGGGLPNVSTRQSNRIRLGVSAAGPDTLYVLYGSRTGFTIGLYRSDDRGETFARRSSSNPRPSANGAASFDLSRTNILHDANDFDSQSDYDLAMAVSPTNVDRVHIGALDTWRSDDGGKTWKRTSNWKLTPGLAGYVHADVHFMAYRGASLFAASDGGIYRSDDGGDEWSVVNNFTRGGGIFQIYSICITPADPNLLFYGTQDNGTWRLRLDGSLTKVAGGDGMVCQISASDARIAYVSYPNGVIARSQDGGDSFNVDITPHDPPDSTRNPPVSGPWLTPYVLGATDADSIFACYGDLWMATNRGFEWRNMTHGALGPSKQCVQVAIAPSDPKTIYVAKRDEEYYSRFHRAGQGNVPPFLGGGGVFRSVDGGASWNVVTGILPLADATLTSLAVSPVDSRRVWVTFAGTKSDVKVFQSSDAGDSWINLSAGLPNVNINVVVARDSPSKGAFIGAEAGAYYRDDQTDGWRPFSDGMPPGLKVTALAINQQSRKLFAGTYGRGVWLTDLDAP